MQKQMSSRIGTLNEKPLHEALKRWYANPGDKLEESVDGFFIDIVRGNLLIEIQTRSFASIRRKLEKLLISHPVRVVYPVTREKWIIKEPIDGTSSASRRKSPRRGGYELLFGELVSIPHLLTNANFSIELLLISEEEVRRFDGIHGWRRHGWVTQERRLLRVIDQRMVTTAEDLLHMVDAQLPESFTTAELAACIARPRRLAQRMAYCLRLAGCIEPAGKRGNAVIYARTQL